MTLLETLLGLGALVAVCVLAGLLVRRSRRVAVREATGEFIDVTLLGADRHGERATLLQFGTDGCENGPRAHGILWEIAAAHPGVRHLHVDVTGRPDLVKRHRIRQTPTTLLLDDAGVVRAIFGGVPNRAVVDLEVERILRTGSTAPRRTSPDRRDAAASSLG